MKRIIAFVLVAASCVSFSFAWDADSFIGKENIIPFDDQISTPALIPEMSLSASQAVYKAVRDTQVMKIESPVLYASEAVTTADTETASSVSGSSLLSIMNPVSSLLAGQVEWYHPAVNDNVGGVDINIPAYNTYTLVPSNGVSFSFGSYMGNGIYQSSYTSDSIVQFNSGGDGAEYVGVRSIVPVGSDYGGFSLDLSSFGTFYSFSFDGVLRYLERLGNYGAWNVYFASSVNLYVNDVLVESFVASSSGDIDFANFVYDSSSPVTSIRLSFFVPYFSYNSDSGRLNFTLQYSDNTAPSFSVLKDTEILDGFNAEGQDRINEFDSIEAVWTGQMSSNYDALNIESFEIPSGLISASALVTGIFSDFWNTLGVFGVVYIFPLTLAIVLLVVGRISKFGGRASSSGKGKGDE